MKKMPLYFNKLLIIIFFIFFNFCFGNDFDNQNKIHSDSTQAYYDLIAEENYYANYKPNVTGIIWGSSLTGIGLTLVGFGTYAIFDNSE